MEEERSREVSEEAWGVRWWSRSVIADGSCWNGGEGGVLLAVVSMVFGVWEWWRCCAVESWTGGVCSWDPMDEEGVYEVFGVYSGGEDGGLWWVCSLWSEVFFSCFVFQPFPFNDKRESNSQPSPIVFFFSIILRLCRWNERVLVSSSGAWFVCSLGLPFLISICHTYLFGHVCNAFWIVACVSFQLHFFILERVLNEGNVFVVPFLFFLFLFLFFYIASYFADTDASCPLPLMTVGSCPLRRDFFILIYFNLLILR